MAYGAAPEAPDDAGTVGGEETPPSAPPADLPSHKTRVEWFEAWEDKASKSLEDQRRDRAYYDGIQHTREELDELKNRHQPAITANYIARKINFILGEEIKKRVDPVARPRTPNHEDDARAATDALRYVEEEQKFDAVRSMVAKNLLIEGVGGAMKSLDDDGKRFRHVLDHIEPDRLFWDPHSRRPDFSDGKYRGVVRWADLDDAIADYPDYEEELRAAVTKDIGNRSSDHTADVPKHQWADKDRERIKIVELYFWDGDDCYRSDFTQADDLGEPQKTIYRDADTGKSICPLVMASCYIDADGNRYGATRGMISPQDEINKRLSKELHLLTVYTVVAPKDSIPDPEKFMSELAKPDGFAEYTAGFHIGTDIIIRDGAVAARGQHEMLMQAINNIQSIGPSSSTLPELPDSASGRAFMARQQAASQELGSFFDSLDQFTQAVFELDWQCVRQFWTDELWLRVTDDEELTGFRFVAINRKVTRAKRMKELMQKGATPQKAMQSAAGELAPVIMRSLQQMPQIPGRPPPDMLPMLLGHPLMQQAITENQVAKMQADIVIDKAPETAVLAQEQFDKLTELGGLIIPNRPDMAGKVIELAVKASDLPDKRALLEAFNAPPDQQQMQQQQAQQQIAMEGAKAEVGVKQTQAQLNAAKAEETRAKTPGEVQKTQAEAMRTAAQAGAATAGAGGPERGF